MQRGARDWSYNPTAPASSKRFLNLCPVLREMPYSVHRSVTRSPFFSRVMNSIRRSTGVCPFQGTTRPPASCLSGVTHVPGLIRYLSTRSVPAEGSGRCLVGATGKMGDVLDRAHGLHGGDLRGGR